MNRTSTTDLRMKVAKEAATLLYSSVEKEYKQAKVKAAKTLGAHFLPSNLEVAMQLDKMAEEEEGPVRKERLILMRREALTLMKILEKYKPLLIGSVWRGTIHKGSDIDVVVHHDEPIDVLEVLKRNNVKVARTEWVTVTKKGKRKGSFHMYAELLTRERAEIKIISREEANRKEKCEIYGDEITGLNMEELEKLLRENPLQRFLPS